MDNFYKSDIIKTDLKYYLRKHILPVKYAYTLSAANYHTEYANSQNYKSTVKINNSEYGLLIKYLQNDKYDYCEIGGDNGEISINIINFLNINGVEFNKYTFVDFSQELLKKCEENFNSIMTNTSNKFIQYDIEQTNSKIPINNSHKKIILFLGNTLGNVESEDNVLQNIFNSMNEDDLFLVGLTLWNNEIDELESYNNDLFRESVLEFLRIIGITTNSNNYVLRYDSVNHKVICEYELKNQFSYDNIQFSVGEKIRCFQSRRYSLDYCEFLFQSNGFNIIEKNLDDESRHVLFLLKKHNRSNIE